MEPAKKLKSATQFLIDARKKSLPPEKMTEALEKIRKGATATLKLPKVINVLDHIGWKVEPMSAWVPLHYKHGDRWILQHADVFKDEPVERHSGMPFDDLRKKMLSEEMTKLPSKVTTGKRIFMEISAVKDGGSPGARYFSWKEWVGCDGFRLTSPRKQVIELLPGRYHIGKIFEVSIDYNPELNKAGWKEDASVALGKEIHVPAAMRTRENTGTCPVCWGNYKLSEGRLVLHGYRRPGWGSVIGSCDGEKYQPAETSVAGLKMWVEKLAEELARNKATALKIAQGLVDKILYNKVWIDKTNPNFNGSLMRLTRDTDEMIKMIGADIERYHKIIAIWKVRPLPKQGEMERGMAFFLKP